MIARLGRHQLQCVLVLAIGLAGAATHAADASPGGPASVPPADLAESSPQMADAANNTAAKVEVLHAALLASMKASDTLDYKARFDKLGPVVQESFDIDLMARRTVGRTQWKRLSPEEQALWLRTFMQTITSDYAGRFTGYRGQSFEVRSQESAKHGTEIVYAALLDPEMSEIAISYRLRETEAGWRIIDIYLKGRVSELALRRSEYSSVIEREGFEGLVASLDERHEKLLADIN